MRLNELKNNERARRKRKRVGRGIGSGKGKTAGRGEKGQKSRSGVALSVFEGGQMPIHRRLPKRGFNNAFKKQYVALNLDRIQAAIDSGKLDPAKPVTEEILVKSGVVTRRRDGVRVLGKGELKSKLTLVVSGASKSAVAAVEKAGGKIEVSAPAPASDEAKAEKSEPQEGQKADEAGSD